MFSSLNDELVYETRVKPITSSPMFNAGTERFIRDWRKTHVTVTVKDSRMRENDPVLGVVFLKVCCFTLQRHGPNLTPYVAIRAFSERIRSHALLVH